MTAYVALLRGVNLGKRQLKIDRIRFDRHHHDRRFTESLDGLDLSACLDTVHLGHDDVHEDEINPRRALFPTVETQQPKCRHG